MTYMKKTVPDLVNCLTETPDISIFAAAGPLLHPDLINIIRITRNHFPCAMIEIVSDVILLLSRPANKTMHKRPLDLAGGQDAGHGTCVSNTYSIPAYNLPGESCIHI